jgi:hypothetical protein
MILLAFLPVVYFPVYNELFPLIHKRCTDQAHVNIPFPNFDLEHLDKFPKQFSDYFDDTLKIKDKLILMNSLFKIKILNGSTINSKVIIGSDGWLFLKTEPFEYYQNKSLYSFYQLVLLQAVLKRRAHWANEHGMKFYLVIAPNKHFIYTEHLPSEFQNEPELDRTDEIMAFMKPDTEVNIIDLRNVLRQHKNPIPLYNKTDNHWNDLGAYYAYTEIIQRLKKDFPSVGSPLKLNSFRIDSSKVAAGLEAMLLDMEEWYTDKKIKLIPQFKEKGVNGKKMNYKFIGWFPLPDEYEIDKETGNATLPSIVVIRDSYTDYLIPFLKEHFKRSVFIFDAWRYKENRNIINKEKPNIVMLIVLDNGINGITLNDFLEDQAVP